VKSLERIGYMPHFISDILCYLDYLKSIFIQNKWVFNNIPKASTSAFYLYKDHVFRIALRIDFLRPSYLDGKAEVAVVVSGIFCLFASVFPRVLIDFRFSAFRFFVKVWTQPYCLRLTALSFLCAIALRMWST